MNRTLVIVVMVLVLVALVVSLVGCTKTATSESPSAGTQMRPPRPSAAIADEVEEGDE